MGGLRVLCLLAFGVLIAGARIFSHDTTPRAVAEAPDERGASCDTDGGDALDLPRLPLLGAADTVKRAAPSAADDIQRGRLYTNEIFRPPILSRV